MPARNPSLLKYPFFPGQFLEVSSARARLRFYVVQIGFEGHIHQSPVRSMYTPNRIAWFLRVGTQ
jgi:hypothetical protein